MSRPDNAGYDPFDAPRPGDGQQFQGSGPQGHGNPGQGGQGYGGQGFGSPGYGDQNSGTPGFGGGPGYEGYYADSSRHPQGMPGGRPAVSTGKGMAIASLILGLLAVPFAFVLFGGLLAVIAIILAIVAMRAGSKARKLGSTQTGGTTAMSIIGIVFSVLALAIFAFVLWGVAIGAGAAAECQHLIDNRDAYDACIQDSILGRLGLN